MTKHNLIPYLRMRDVSHVNIHVLSGKPMGIALTRDSFSISREQAEEYLRFMKMYPTISTEDNKRKDWYAISSLKDWMK